MRLKRKRKRGNTTEGRGGRELGERRKLNRKGEVKKEEMEGREAWKKEENMEKEGKKEYKKKTKFNEE